MCIDCTRVICLLALLVLVVAFCFRKSLGLSELSRFATMSWAVAYVSIALLFMDCLVRRTALEPILRQHPIWFIASSCRCLNLWWNDRLPPGPCLNEPD